MYPCKNSQKNDVLRMILKQRQPLWKMGSPSNDERFVSLSLWSLFTGKHGDWLTFLYTGNFNMLENP